MAQGRHAAAQGGEAAAGDVAALEGEAGGKQGAPPPEKAKLYACARSKGSCLRRRLRRVRQGWRRLRRVRQGYTHLFRLLTSHPTPLIS